MKILKRINAIYIEKKLSLLLNLLDSGFTKAIMWSTEPCGIPIDNIIEIKIMLEYVSPISKKISDSEKIKPTILDVTRP